ncbi:MAG: TerC/Alx family metal homeostasis membrane protein [Myxococcales bacterium]
MTWFWTGFIVLVLCLLALDLGVLNKRAHQPSIKEALGWTAGWITLGVLFSGVVYYIYEHKLYSQIEGSGTIPYGGADAMLTYLTGFVLEESLSIDNLFVMVLIFRSYKIPGTYQHRVLFWGILGAIVMRAIMILGGVWLVTHFHWVMYLFGMYLVVQGLLQFKPEKEDEDDDESPAKTWLEKLIGRVLPVTRESNPEGHFVMRLGPENKLHATQLLVALISVEAADVVFALDSVPAVLTVSTDPFIVFTSNVFAILGLRSLYFVIAGMMDRFGHLKYALAAILIFVGAKMCLHKIVHIPISLSLVFIVSAVIAGVLTSMYASRGAAHKDSEA